MATFKTSQADELKAPELTDVQKLAEVLREVANAVGIHAHNETLDSLASKEEENEDV